MRLYRLISVLSLVSAFIAVAIAQENSKYIIRAGADIGLTNGVSISSPLEFNTNKSSVSNFNIDFGYNFWHKQKMSLNINAGIGYENITTSLSMDKMNYVYLSPANTDEDGNEYLRYYELSDMNQKINAAYFSVPIYLSFQYQVSKRLALHADIGIRMGFKLSTDVKEGTVNSYSYGIYPEYDDLMIDAEWINNFVNSVIDKNSMEKPQATGFTTSLLLGIGAEIGIVGPVSLDIGIRYTAGMNNLYSKKYSISNPVNIKDAPVSYSYPAGDLVRPLVNYSTKSSLSNLAIRAGINLNF